MTFAEVIEPIDDMLDELNERVNRAIAAIRKHDEERKAIGIR